MFTFSQWVSLKRAVTAHQEPGPDPTGLLGDRRTDLGVLHRVGVEPTGRAFRPNHERHLARLDGPGQVEMLLESAQPLIGWAMLEGTGGRALDNGGVDEHRCTPGVATFQ